MRLSLSAGEYEITASPDDTIRVAWRTEGRDDDVDVNIEVRGARAEVAIDGPSENFQRVNTICART